MSDDMTDRVKVAAQIVEKNAEILRLWARIAALVKAGDDLADAFTYSQNVQGTLTADLFTVRQWREAKGER